MGVNVKINGGVPGTFSINQTFQNLEETMPKTGLEIKGKLIKCRIIILFIPLTIQNVHPCKSWLANIGQFMRSIMRKQIYNI